MIEEIIRNHIVSSPDIVKIIGDRAFPIVARKDAKTPFLIYSFQNKNNEAEMMDASAGIISGLLNVIIISEDAMTALRLSELLQPLFHRANFENRVTDDFPGKIQFSSWQTERQNYDPSLDMIIIENDFRVKFRTTWPR